MLSMMLMLFMVLILMYRLLQLLVIRLVCVWSTRSIATGSCPNCLRRAKLGPAIMLKVNHSLSALPQP